MPRFFISSSRICDNIIEITGEDFHHLGRVRRAAPGDLLDLVIDGGRHIAARITAVEDDKIIAQIIDEKEAPSSGENYRKKGSPVPSVVKAGQAEVPVHLYLSLLKGSNFDLALKKAVETGVSEITPVITERTIPKVDKKSGSKTERWKKIVEEAAKQSYRSMIPVLHEVISFRDIPVVDNNSLSIIAHLKGGRHIREVLRSDNHEVFNILVGPEGDSLRRKSHLHLIGDGNRHFSASVSSGRKPPLLCFPH